MTEAMGPHFVNLIERVAASSTCGVFCALRGDLRIIHKFPNANNVVI